MTRIKQSQFDRLLHLCLFWHWPEYSLVPISDYLEWRVCDRCRK